MSNKQKTVYTVLVTMVATFIVSTVLYLSFGTNLVYFMTQNKNASALNKLTRIDNLIDEYYYGEYDKDKMRDMAYVGYMAGVGDQYTQYITSEEYASFTEMSEGEYKGIGIEIIQNEKGIVITDVFEGTPAEKSGFLIGDVITKIDGVETKDKTSSEVASLVKNRKDENNVVIDILRDENPVTIDVKCDNIVTTNASQKMIGDISYIRISMFEGHCTKQLKEALKATKENNAKGIVFDVRSNPGGALNIILDCVDMILDEGTILTIKDKKGHEDVYKAKDEEKIDLPMIILTNGSTASAAEVFASSLHDNGKAKIVGTKTYGKGVVQSVFDLGDNSIAKITTAKYFTPNNVCIDKIGITPDEVVELEEEYNNISIKQIPFEKDTQLNKALQMLK